MIPDPRFARAQEKPQRRSAAFRLLLFFSLFLGLMVAAGVVEVISFGPRAMIHLSLAAEAAAAASLLVAMAVTARMTGDGLAAFGLGGPHGLRNFLVGIVSGAGLLAAELAAMSALGAYSFGNAAGDAAVRSTLAAAAIFLCVGFTEEGLWRGYALVQFSRVASFWPAVIVWSALFGAGHMANPGETWIGAIVAMAFGLAFSLSFRLTGSLWLAIGLHAAWDFAQSYVFGVSDSGLAARGALLHPAIHGPDWLTGGSVGPEGSVLVAAPLLAIVALSWLLRRKVAFCAPE